MNDDEGGRYIQSHPSKIKVQRKHTIKEGLFFIIV